MRLDRNSNLQRLDFNSKYLLQPTEKRLTLNDKIGVLMEALIFVSCLGMGMTALYLAFM